MDIIQQMFWGIWFLLMTKMQNPPPQLPAVNYEQYLMCISSLCSYLLLLFINDLPLALDKSDTDMYADDSSATTSARTVLEIQQHLVKDADKVSKWCSDNHMATNPTKTKVMLITTWPKRASLLEHQRTLKVRMDGQCLQNVSSNKLLGITINHNLSWE